MCLNLVMDSVRFAGRFSNFLMLKLRIYSMSVEFKEVDAVYGITSPWQISSITTDKESKEVSLYVSCTDESTLPCPKCDRVYPVYDRRPWKWRHLDTRKYRTYVVAPTPRVKCLVHGVRTIMVPWASRSARLNG